MATSAPPLLRRAWTNRGLLETFGRSALAARRHRADFDQVEIYCMFIGYPRSGHSLVGSLLDAHPDAVIAHELDALRYFRSGFRRSQVWSLILENDREFTAGGRQARVDYTYEVPGQWQGRFHRLRVIGDKKGGKSTVRVSQDPKILHRVRRVVRVPMRFVHVTRNPFDNIATMAKRSSQPLPQAMDRYFSLCDTNQETRRRADPSEMLDLRHEDLLADPRRSLTQLCRHVGLEAADGYLEDCASILFASPRQTRHDAPWSPELVSEATDRMASFGFLEGYTFDR